jgi:hypothetical protein
VTPKGSLHDRLILLDRAVVWSLGQSFNQLAVRSPTSLSKVDPETARMKIDHYDLLWAASTPL